MQAYYGITPAQAASSGYAPYDAGAGWRDASAAVKLRRDIDDNWIVLGSFGLSRLLGAAAGSPLTHSRFGWTLNAGAARRF